MINEMFVQHHTYNKNSPFKSLLHLPDHNQANLSTKDGSTFIFSNFWLRLDHKSQKYAMVEIGHKTLLFDWHFYAEQLCFNIKI